MPQYFNKFPKIYYDAAGHGNYKLVTNLLRRVQIKGGLKESGALFDMYDVGGEETPESVSEQFYGDQKYYWIIYYLTMLKIVSMTGHYQVSNLKHTSMTSMLM
tara:strand:+ start:270 stop:578 length:309 start_codon:yes stop_codon:yes gene_type:complete